jgi:hypothetical protein
VPTPTVPLRDLVIEHPSRRSSRVLARSSLQRYGVGDGRSVEITVSPLCNALTCQDADPQAIASFLGTLPHGDEMNLLNVDLEPAIELASTCGSGDAQACYFSDQNLMAINGNDTAAPDGASRAYVIAHEYGHHLANHRNNAPFDNPAIDWGPKNWASFARVCQGVRAGRYFPGNESSHYFQNPGEAFAESFAHNRFPSDPVPWEWPDFPDPHAGAFPAIQTDALDPWNGPTTDTRRGRFPRKQKRKRRTKVNRKVKRFETPRDGDMKITLNGADRADLALKLLGSDGRLLAQSDGVGSREQVSFQICGERHLTAIVRRHDRRRSRFSLNALLP